MKKNIILIAFVITAVGVAAYLGYYLFLSPEGKSSTETGGDETVAESSEDAQESGIDASTTTTEGTEGAGTFTEDGQSLDTGDCPDGYICFGDDTIATVPTITLGERRVLAQEVSGQEVPTQTTATTADQIAEPTVIADNTPQNVIITNKDFRIWTVSWVTKSAVTGYVKYGPGPNLMTRSINDDRDVSSNNMQKRFTHHVTITNPESDLNEDSITYSFVIVSDGEEFPGGDSPNTYQNAPLTTSPSSPISVAVTAAPISGYSKDDYIAIARQVDADGDKSTPVSGVFSSSGGLELIIGIARNEDLNSYFAYSDSNNLEVKLYGPDGYTDFKKVTLGQISNDTISMDLKSTGYRGEIFEALSESTRTTTTRTAATTTTTKRPKVDNLPRTGVEDSVAFKSLFGFVIFLLGICIIMLIVPWNFKKLWEERVVERMEE